MTEVIDIRNTSYIELAYNPQNITINVLTAANKNLVGSIFVSQLWSVTLSRFLLMTIIVSKRYPLEVPLFQVDQCSGVDEGNN